MHNLRCILLAICHFLILALGSGASANDPALNTEGLPSKRLLPETAFDDQIQSPESFFGFQLGSRHLLHHQVSAYSKYLADASEHVRLIPYATSHGKRDLYVLLIARDADKLDLRQLEEHRRSLTSGESNAESADAVNSVFSDKTLAYFGYTIHGDEASGMNAFPAVAYYLAAGGDQLRNDTLDHAIVLLDPCLNPDGSDRFANWVNENRGRFPGRNDLDREHSQPWPRGRTNYYWFDLNRDWLPTAHPESKGRIELFHKMKPNALLDFHEMGSTSSYFFQPGIPARNNPLTPDAVFQLTRKFAAEHAKAMDAANQLYFTEERFDDFYMGKGSTYPDLHGAIGILFEQGSSRGLLSSNDRYTRTFTDTIANQVRTSISSLQALEDAHDELLTHQATFYRQAIEMAAETPTKAYVLHASGDTSRITAAATLLRRHDIQVWIPTSNVTIEGNELKPGTALVIPTNQPEFRFIQSLMQREQSFPENIFYDVSAWTLPLAFDLQVIDFRSDIPDLWKPESTTSHSLSNQAHAPSDASTVLAYAIDPVSLDAPKVIAKIMRAGFEVRVAYDPFNAEIEIGQQREFRRGSWIIAKPSNAEKWSDIRATLDAAKADADVTIFPLISGLSPVGPDLGSDANKVVPAANLLLVVGEGTSALDAGSIWHFLDHRLELPVTIINAQDLGGIDLRSYTCIVLPGGSYQTIGSPETEKLSSYVDAGGTLVALQSAIDWLQSKGLAVKAEKVDSSDAKMNSEAQQPQHFAQAADASALENIAGAIFSVTVDNTHPLAFGFPDAAVPVFRDSSKSHPVPKNYLTTAAKYEDVMAGYVSVTNRERLSSTAAVWAENKGDGRIIFIVDNPVFRGYFRGSERFLTNAILLGPTLRIPSLIFKN